MDFLATLDRLSHRGMLYKMRSLDVGRKFLSIVSEFLSDRRQRVGLYDKVNASIDVVPRVSQVVF